MHGEVRRWCLSLGLMPKRLHEYDAHLFSAQGLAHLSMTLIGPNSLSQVDGFTGAPIPRRAKGISIAISDFLRQSGKHLANI